MYSQQSMTIPHMDLHWTKTRWITATCAVRCCNEQQSGGTIFISRELSTWWSSSAFWLAILELERPTDRRRANGKRDLTVFVDDDTQGIPFTSSENNSVMHISELKRGLSFDHWN
eukprot:CCRYP_005362-RA/>CCRYP_005362-RA protein AED:0.45 eAED:0.91 QI:0/0/0/1/0/0/2/0/114